MITENAVQDAVGIYSDFREQLVWQLEESRSLENAKILLQSYLDNSFLERLSKQVQEAVQTAEAVGRSVIAEKDRAAGNTVTAKDKSLSWFLCDDGVVRVSFDLIPKEALDYIRYKSLTIAGVEHGKLLNAVKAAIESAIRDGKTVREFRSEVDQIFDSFGIDRLSSRHIDTVFRTNIFTSYSIGSQAQVDQMRDRFPLWRYSAIRDSRTRPDHRDLDGRIFRVGEGPVPPIDYNCRCTAIYIHVSQADRENLWDRAQGWSGAGFQRFNSREAFETWKNRNSEAISPEISAWIGLNL